ncbi:LPXTG cell wall anchor domain-containing protein [Pseudoruminococcus massiliensis]|uniref:LPXTG cell wall anchor domain-containing protein n=1 Tax=Pseudoruminococcus massiliensis TaxID=2086583 RepID=UPI003AB46E85
MKKKILAALATASVAVSSIVASVSAATLGDSTSVKPSDVSNITSNGKVPTTGDASTTLLLVAGAVAVVALTTIIVAVKSKKTAK